jgi:hypothetical protein
MCPLHPNASLSDLGILFISKGKFRENGSCGYVLKPEYLRSSAAMSPPVRLTIHIISGQQLPKPGAERTGEIIDPYIVINIIGKWRYNVREQLSPPPLSY